MQYLLVLLFSAAAIAHPQVRRADLTIPTFTVNQSAMEPGWKPAGPLALIRGIRKYGHLGLQASADLRSAAMKAAVTNDGSVAAAPDRFDSEYIEIVTVGASSLRLDFDTGSSDLWVFSSELTTAAQSGHRIYQPSRAARKLAGQLWSISYGDGSSASGDVFVDTVGVGATQVTMQAVETAQTVSTSFSQGIDDGLLGLAFGSINTVSPTQQKTFFENAAPSLDAPLFAVDLKKGRPGTYDFGFIDPAKYNAPITYTQVDNSQGFWAFTSSGFRVGRGPFITRNIKAIADTGTSLLLIDNEVVAAYYRTVAGAINDAAQGGWIFPCASRLPDLTIQIEGYAATVPGSFINYAPADGTRNQCFGGVQSAGAGQMSILGDIFLKSQFVVFSLDGPRLGFAPKDL